MIAGYLLFAVVVVTSLSAQALGVDPDCLTSVKYWPDIYDCSKYYECNAANEKQSMSCPGDLLWNPLIFTCDRKEDVDCSWTVTASTATTPTTTPTTPTTTTTTPTTTEPTTTSSSVTGVSPGGYCAVEDQYNADPYDCRGYYQCHHNGWMHYDCPSPLWWNVHVVGCALDSDCIQVSTVSTPTTSAYCASGDVTGDPADCHKFFYCDSSKWIGPLDCPADLYWSTDLKACVDIKISDCN